MKSVFKVKNAKSTVKEIFINGLRSIRGGDFSLTKDSIKVCPALKKGEKLTYTQETTVVV